MAIRAPILAVLLIVVAPTSAGAEELIVIAHPKRSEQLSKAEVAQIYLRKRRFWSDGKGILPVNRESDSRLREAFVRLVLREDPRQLVVYWNRQYFNGVLPPATLASDEAVKRFVAEEQRAIGYIAPEFLDDTVHVVLRVPDAGSPSD